MNLSISRTIHRRVEILLLSLGIVISPARAASAVVPLSPREGFIQVDGGPIWYRIYGTGTRTPLLLVHGGPGSRSCAFEPLAELMSKERPVILYDQLGSGRSGRPADTNLWTLKRFVAELGQVRAALGLGNVHLLGHSWGAGLVVSYLGSAGLSGVESATLIGPYLSTKTWIEDADLLLAQLPEQVQQTLKRHEQAGTTQSQEYLAATEVFYSRFYYHKPKPPLPASCEESPRNDHIYRQMWGPSEFRATGSLLDFDVTPLLPQLNLPVLIVVGRFDEARPETASGFARKLPNAQVSIVEDCGHMVPLEAPAILADEIAHFLRQEPDKQKRRK
jgi:proline-specific peptidase